MVDYSIITNNICHKANEFGFSEAKVASINIDTQTRKNFDKYLEAKFHGSMHYLSYNRHLRFHPQNLHSNTLSIICVRAPYLTQPISYHNKRLENSKIAYISNYALGRNYHKTVKQRLEHYAKWIASYLKSFNIDLSYRVFTDSAPILEVAIAQNAGLGFRGKNTLLINTKAGSTFFLGEIFVNLPLIANTSPHKGQCGSCKKCLDICPTKAFTSPYVLEARKCISYLTIENKDIIPIEYRKAMGNRIYGCDDCQLICPWNKFSQLTTIPDFGTRHNLDSIYLIEAFLLSKLKWENMMRGTVIYRIGYECWLRNVAVALGNSKTSPEIIQALKKHQNHPSFLVRDHVAWAVAQHIKT